MSLAFDQNMRPFVAFVQAGVAKHWWYNSAIQDREITELPVGSISPRCCIDDKREYRHGTSDIVLCYVLDGALWHALERERYTIPRVVVDPFVNPLNGAAASLVKVGMNAIGRLQWTGSS